MFVKTHISQSVFQKDHVHSRQDGWAGIMKASACVRGAEATLVYISVF